MATRSLNIKYLLLFLAFCYTHVAFAQDPATLPVEMVYVEGGSYTMGCVAGRDDINGLDCFNDEFPAHTVTLRDFYIGKYEVTQGQYQAIMGDNPSSFAACGLDCPVEFVNWYAMIIFCNELTLQDASLNATERVYYRDAAMTEPWTIAHYSPADGDPASGDVYFDESRRGYRLPTEAEWEYAARGGNLSQGHQFAGTSDAANLALYGNFCDTNCSYSWADATQDDGYANTAPVGTYLPNELGIHDMTGNVWERCWDEKDDYSSGNECNPYGTPNSLWTNGSFGHSSGACCPVARAGSWYNSTVGSRVSDRYGGNDPLNQSLDIGFRVSRYP